MAAFAFSRLGVSIIEIFKLFGTIFIDNDPANRKLDETDARAGKVGITLANTARTAARWGAAIAAGAAAAGGALFALVNRITDTASAIDAKRKQLGITSEALQEYRYAADQVGIAQDSMERALGRLNQRIGMAERGNAKYAESLRELNVTSNNAAEAFIQAIETLHQMDDANAQAAAAADLFGTQLARQLMPAIEAGGEAMLALRNRAHELGKVMDQDSTIAANNYQSALADVRGVIAGIAQDVVMRLLPTFERWLVWSADNIPKVWAVFQFLGEVVEIVIRHTSRALQPWLQLLSGLFGEAWSWTVDVVGSAWQWLVDTTWAEKIQDIKGWLTTGWTWLVDIGGAAWDWLTNVTWVDEIDNVRGWLSNAWTWTVDLAGRVWAWLDEKAPWATETIRTLRDWLLTAWSWTIDIAGSAWEWLDERTPWLTSLLETLWGLIHQTWAWTIDTAGSAWAWLTETSWAEKVETVKGWLSSAWIWTIGIAGVAWDWLIDTTWADKINDIRGWLSSVWNWTIETTGSAWQWLDERAPTLTSLLESLWGWITGAWVWVVDTSGTAWEWLVGTTLQEKLDGIKSLLSEAYSLVINIAGSAWVWLTETSWAEKTADIAAFFGTVYEWTIDTAGSAWAWLDEKFPALTASLQTLWDWFSLAWEWTLDLSGVQSAVEWFQKYEEAIIAITAGITAGVAAYKGINAAIALYTALTSGAATATGVLSAAVAFLTSPVFLISAAIGGAVAAGVALWRNWDKVTEWAGNLRESLIELKDKGLAAVQAMAEGIAEWFSETKLGKTFTWIGEQVRTVTGWFYEMYDKVVGHSYVPDMVEEIGEAIARLRERLANPVVRYTSEVISAFGDMEEEVVASMMSMAERMDEVLVGIVDRVAEFVGTMTRELWHGTATWSGLFESFGSAAGRIFGSIFDAIAKELIANIIAQNQWVAQTLANIAATITGMISQAYATLVAFFAWSGPLAPVLAGGVIATAIAAIASFGGSLIRGLLPDVPGSSAPSSGSSGSTGRSPAGGRQVSEITGPTRDLLVTLLSPLARLDEQTGILGRIYDTLNMRLPDFRGLEFAGASAPQITFQAGAIQIHTPNGSPREISDTLLDVIEERIADRMAFNRRGVGG